MFSSTKKLVRAGMIAALYTVMTCFLGEIAYGPFQVRPAEALCILPIFFAEAVPGLFIGCALANIFSQFGVYDVAFGSLTTLVAAILTFIVGRIFKEKFVSVLIGGVPPVVLNAFFIPLIIVLGGAGEDTYFTLFLSFLLTETVWVYGLGIPLFFAVKRIKKTVLLGEDLKKKEQKNGTDSSE